VTKGSIGTAGEKVPKGRVTRRPVLKGQFKTEDTVVDWSIQKLCICWRKRSEGERQDRNTVHVKLWKWSPGARKGRCLEVYNG
jgi:hypothetical protein